jgi:hypothetical protein
MVHIANVVRQTALGSPNVKGLAKRLRAELFILELDLTQPPRLKNGTFSCACYITCRLRAGTIEFDAFMHQLRQSQATIRFQDRTISNTFDSNYETPDNYRLKLNFSVLSREDEFDVGLIETGSDTNHISGSPFTLGRLIKQ